VGELLGDSEQAEGGESKRRWEVGRDELRTEIFGGQSRFAHSHLLPTAPAPRLHHAGSGLCPLHRRAGDARARQLRVRGRGLVIVCPCERTSARGGGPPQGLRRPRGARRGRRRADQAVLPGAQGGAGSGACVCDGRGEGTLPAGVRSHVSRSLFPCAQPGAADEVRRIRVPPNRFTPLKEQWDALVKPVTEQMKLLIRMNTKAKAIELKVRDKRDFERADDTKRLVARVRAHARPCPQSFVHASSHVHHCIGGQAAAPLQSRSVA
jgi:hypothetical protein